MRKFSLLGLTTLAAVILGGAAQAADLPRKAPPPPAPVMYNWTGFYIGAHIGGGWVDRDGDHRFHNDHRCFGGDSYGTVCFDDRRHGGSDGSFLAGGQIGFNYQVGAMVWGFEAQASWVDHDDDHACGFFRLGEGPVRDHLFRCSNGGGWVATIAARLGVAVGATGNWLLYVKGGAAFADAGFDITRRSDCTFTFCSSSNFDFVNNGDDTRTGWMIGFGVENGLSSNWSWKLEYNFMDFGGDDRHFDHVVCEGCRLRFDFNVDHQVHVVKFGLNYRFGPAPAPVAARY